MSIDCIAWPVRVCVSEWDTRLHQSVLCRISHTFRHDYHAPITMTADVSSPPSTSKSGFDFGSYSRNNFLGSKGYPVPKATSTGTTIVGCIFKDGVVLGADTRATEGPIVADKNCEKVSCCRRSFSTGYSL